MNEWPIHNSQFYDEYLSLSAKLNLLDGINDKIWDIEQNEYCQVDDNYNPVPFDDWISKQNIFSVKGHYQGFLFLWSLSQKE